MTVSRGSSAPLPRAGGHLLGIDLAADPSTTGVVVLRPRGGGRWHAEVIERRADDDLLVELARGASMVGVDAPLGWPDEFVTSVAAHHASGTWQGGTDRTRLRYRVTDLETRRLVGGRLPLSVSTDLLGVVALRGALLQQRWADEVWGAPAPRDGSGLVAETYPAAAFAAWGIDAAGYKHRRRTDAARAVRARIVDSIGRDTGRWLDLAGSADACVDSDHVLDALVCCLVAVSIGQGATHRPDAEQEDAARREGWIHVPTVPLADVHP